jgi:ADP-glucose pyrophosphorylase
MSGWVCSTRPAHWIRTWPAAVRGIWTAPVAAAGDWCRNRVPAPSTETGFSQGNADNLLRLSDDIQTFGPDTLVVMSADHVFSLDLRQVLRAHRDTGAECTLVTAEVTRAQAQQNAVVVTNSRGRVTQFQYKPSAPASGTVATEIFV